MQVCTLLQTDNHTSTPPLCFLQSGCPSCRPTNSVKALKAFFLYLPRCEDHVCSASSSLKATLALGDDVAYADVIIEATEQHTSKNLSSSLDEIQKAINQMSNGKAPGTDGIPAEVFKKCCSCLLPHLVDLVEAIWSEAAVPQDFKDATIVHIYKRKGDRSCCDNHRGMSLLSTAGKILARVLLNRLNDHVGISNIIPESQCGFQAGRGTTDMIFAARQIQEKCREQNRDLYMVFIDLTKAFDLVNRQASAQEDWLHREVC